MDSEIKQRLVRVIGWSGYSASVIVFLFGLCVYMAGSARFVGERWDDMRDGLPLMLWGVGFLVATTLALYVLDGRLPITRETPAKLLSPSIPYWKFALLAVGAAAVGFAIANSYGRYSGRGVLFDEAGVLLVVLGVPLAVLFAVMAVVVKRR